MKKLLTILLLCIVALAQTTGEANACRKVTVRQVMDLVKVFAGKDTKYVIKQDINLGGKTVKIGEGSTLIFQGGSLANGTLVGNKTKIKAEDYEIFKHGLRTFRGYTLNGSYKYAIKTVNAIVIEGTWNNTQCGSKWTGMEVFTPNDCAGLAINNFIRLHKRGSEVTFPKNGVYHVYEQIVCSGYSVDFNNSVIKSIDFNKVEDKSISLPSGANSRALKSLYGLVVFGGDNAFLKNLVIDGCSRTRDETPSLGTECLLAMNTNNSCLLESIVLDYAVGCGICTYSISDCTFRNVTINGCGEHGIYTHAYQGSLKFEKCSFINCGQNPALYKKRGQSACVKFSGSRDRDYSQLKDLKAYFSHCLFQAENDSFPVATTYSDLPYAEFIYCEWRGNVSGYSVGSSEFAEKIGRLIEYRFENCVNPCAKIRSSNTIRRLINCSEVHNPFADAVELSGCEIMAGYAEVENIYTGAFVAEYGKPVVCKDCSFVKRGGDYSVRNAIKSPRPMRFIRCKWEFAPSEIIKNKGSYYLVLSGEKSQNSVRFESCDFTMDQYRMLYCNDTDVEFKDCNYISSYGPLVVAQADQPNRIRVSSMNNAKQLPVARHFVAKDQ